MAEKPSMPPGKAPGSDNYLISFQSWRPRDIDFRWTQLNRSSAVRFTSTIIRFFESCSCIRSTWETQTRKCSNLSIEKPQKRLSTVKRDDHKKLSVIQSMLPISKLFSFGFKVKICCGCCCSAPANASTGAATSGFADAAAGASGNLLQKVLRVKGLFVQTVKVLLLRGLLLHVQVKTPETSRLTTKGTTCLMHSHIMQH